jgi:hypothetical protein
MTAQIYACVCQIVASFQVLQRPFIIIIISSLSHACYLPRLLTFLDVIAPAFGEEYKYETPH